MPCKACLPEPFPDLVEHWRNQDPEQQIREAIAWSGASSGRGSAWGVLDGKPSIGMGIDELINQVCGIMTLIGEIFQQARSFKVAPQKLL